MGRFCLPGRVAELQLARPLFRLTSKSSPPPPPDRMGVPSAAVVAIMENKGGISASSQKGMKVGPSAKKRRKQPDDAALDRSPRDPKKAKKADGEADAAPPKAAAETPPQSAEEFRKSHSMKARSIAPFAQAFGRSLPWQIEQ